MKYQKYILCTIALIAACTHVPHAQAQGGSSGVGGGGDYLACPENGGIRHYLLDTYEEKGQWTIDAGNGATLEERVAYVLDRLGGMDPVRADRYSREAQVILSGIRELRSQPRLERSGQVIRLSPIRDIDDADETFDFERLGCTKQQMVRQDLDTDNGKTQYTFDLGLLGLLDLNQQVATVLHEVIYQELRERGATTSKKAREFNRLILDPRMKSYASCQYAVKTKNVGLGGYLILGTVDSTLQNYECDASNNIRVLHEASYPFFGVKLRSKRSFLLKDVGLKNGRTPVDADLGRLTSGYPKVGKELDLQQNDLHGGQVRFNGDGTLLWTGLQKYSDSGSIRFVTTPALEVLSIQDQGYYNASLSQPVLARLAQFAAEIKRREPLFRADAKERRRVLGIVARVRAEIPGGDLSRIEAAVQELKTGAVSAEPEVADPGAEAWLARVEDSRLIRCFLSETGITGGIGIALQASRQKLICLQANGDSRLYRGRINVRLGGGMLGGIYHLDNVQAFADQGVRVQVDDQIFRLFAIAGPYTFGDDPDFRRWGAGVAFFVSPNRYGKALGPTFRQKGVVPGTEGLVDALTAKILVDRATYPQRSGPE
jgi:hypothetical protein